MDPIRCFYLLRKRPGGHVCKGLLVSEHSINASQRLYNSVYLFVTVLLFSTQFIRQFVWAVYSVHVSNTEKEKARLRDIVTASKRCIKKPSDRFIYCRKFCKTVFYVSLPFTCPFERCNWTSKQLDIFNTWSALAMHSPACESSCRQVILNQHDAATWLKWVKVSYTLYVIN